MTHVVACALRTGFINFRVSDTCVMEGVRGLALDGFRSRMPASERQRVLLDFGSPNVGKELHVGHLRSACIGDSLARLLEWQGHSVTRESHVGDIGMPVALVVTALVDAFRLAQPHTTQRQEQRPDEWVARSFTAGDLGDMCVWGWARCDCDACCVLVACRPVACGRVPLP